MASLIQPFGMLLKFFYDLTGNYGWALVLFTILVNVILTPLYYKQQKSTFEMQKIQPKMAEIQKKYANDKEKQSQEMMKLYQQNHINPMGGCLPLLIQFPLIMILYQAIMKPITYMYGSAYGFTAKAVADLSAKAATLLNIGTRAQVSEINIFAAVRQDPSIWTFKVAPINFHFLGLDLDVVPSFSHPSILWLIPLFCVLSTFAISKLSMSQTQQNNTNQKNPTADSMKTMTMLMPLMTGFFAFSLPAALGFYWILTNIVRFLQQMLFTIYFKNKENNDPLIIDNKKK